MFIIKLCFTYFLTMICFSSIYAGEAVISEAAICANQLRNVQLEMSACNDLAKEASRRGNENDATYYQIRVDRHSKTADKIKDRLDTFGTFNYDDYDDPELAKLRNGIRYMPDGIGYDLDGHIINSSREAKGKEKEDIWFQKNKPSQKTFIPYKSLSAVATFIGTILVSEYFLKDHFQKEKKEFEALSPEQKRERIKLHQTPAKRRWSFNVCMGLMTSSIVGLISFIFF